LRPLALPKNTAGNKFVGMAVFYSLAGRIIEREILPLAADQKPGHDALEPVGRWFPGRQIFPRS